MAPQGTRPYHSLKVGNKNWKLRLTTNAIAEAEDLMDIGLPEIASKFATGTFKFLHVRGLLWAALLPEHEDEGMSIGDAGDLVDKVGLDEIIEPLTNALFDALPEPKKARGKAAGSKANGKAPKNQELTVADSTGEDS